MENLVIREVKICRMVCDCCGGTIRILPGDHKLGIVGPADECECGGHAIAQREYVIECSHVWCLSCPANNHKPINWRAPEALGNNLRCPDCHQELEPYDVVHNAYFAKTGFMSRFDEVNRSDKVDWNKIQANVHGLMEDDPCPGLI